MPTKFDEILKQRDKYHADNMETMNITDYRAFLETGALIEKDHHGFVRCALSGEMLAVNPEQTDALIEFLKGITAGAIRLFVIFCKLFVRGCSTLFTERIGIFYPN